MPSFSQAMIMGHLGGDPDMRYTPNGNPVTSFSVATNRYYTDSSGEKREETQWWRVTAWGRLAEVCNENLAKGNLVFVVGHPRLRTWQRQDGSTAATLEVIASRVLFLTKEQREEEIPAITEPEEEIPPF
jgi:single-strand DNA-binding protein